jgi:membrane-associated PAP2 superfamily phosphatase
MIDTPSRRRHADFLIAAISLALLLAWDLSGLDLAASRLVAGPAGFGWRDAWVTKVLFHEGGRVFAWLLLGLLAVNVWHPLIDGPTRAERLRWLLVTLACLLLVPALKRVSATSCPWDLAEFGGMASYVSHWRFGIGDDGPGHCFPSGHAVSAFAFLSGWFALRRRRPALAQRWLAAVLLIGVLYGGTQFLRGAHYISHTLWTAWFCWSLCALVYTSLPGRAAARLEPQGQVL